MSNKRFYLLVLLLLIILVFLVSCIPNSVKITPPKNLKLYLETNKNVLLWEMPDNGRVAYYKVYKDDIKIGETVETYFEDYGLLSERDDVLYKVVAVDKKGDESSPAQISSSDSNVWVHIGGNVLDINDITKKIPGATIQFADKLYLSDGSGAFSFYVKKSADLIKISVNHSSYEKTEFQIKANEPNDNIKLTLKKIDVTEKIVKEEGKTFEDPNGEIVVGLLPDSLTEDGSIRISGVDSDYGIRNGKVFEIGINPVTNKIVKPLVVTIKLAKNEKGVALLCNSNLIQNNIPSFREAVTELTDEGLLTFQLKRYQDGIWSTVKKSSFDPDLITVTGEIDESGIYAAIPDIDIPISLKQSSEESPVFAAVKVIDSIIANVSLNMDVFSREIIDNYFGGILIGNYVFEVYESSNIVTRKIVQKVYVAPEGIDPKFSENFRDVEVRLDSSPSAPGNTGYEFFINADTCELIDENVFNSLNSDADIDNFFSEVNGYHILDFLEEGKTYTLKLIVEISTPFGKIERKFDLGNFSVSQTVSPPDMPEILNLTTGTDYIYIDWTEEPSSNFEKYRVYINKSGVFDENDFVLEINEPETSEATIDDFIFPDLRDNTEYKVMVVTYNDQGLSSKSLISSVKTLNAPPQASVLFLSSIDNPVTSRSVCLSWEESEAEDFAKYVITYGGSSTEITSRAVTSYTIQNLDPDTEYSFRLLTFDTGGAYAESNVLTVKTKEHFPPVAPKIKLAEIEKNYEGNYNITLYWSDISTTNDGYKVYRNGEEIASNLGANSYKYVDENLVTTPGKKISYAVVAFDHLGYGSSDATDVIIPVDKPSPPTNVTFEPQIDSIKLLWLPSLYAKGYKVYMSMDSINWTLKSQTINTSLRIEGLLPGNSYLFKISAFNDAGESELSETIVATTLELPELAAPSNLISEEIAFDHVELSWNTVEGAQAYKIYRDSVETPIMINYGNSSIKFTDTSVKAETQYTYYISAYNEDYGESDLVSITVTTPAPPVPATPTGLKAIYNSNFEGIEIEWESSGDIDGYEIEKKYEDSYCFIRVDKETTYYLDINVLGNHTYLYRIRSFNSFGTSGWSDYVSVFTPNLPPSSPEILYPAMGTEVLKDDLYLQWSNSVDPDRDDVEYVLYLGRSPDNLYEIVSGTETSFVPVGLSTGIYYWKVIARDSHDGISASKISSFSVKGIGPVWKLIPVQSLDEGEKLEISLTEYVSDPDGFITSIEKVDGIGDVLDGIFTYSPDYLSAGSYIVKLKAIDNDGMETFTNLSVIVKNVNRKPIVDDIHDQHISEGSLLELEISAVDPDIDDTLLFTLTGPGTITKLNGNTVQYSWTPDYESAGEHEVIIAVSDGEYTVTDSFTITVENTNRPPILQIPDKHTSEGSTLVFDLSEYASDPDGDALSFRKVSGDGELSGSVFTYTAGYEDEGDHEVVVAVSDGATEVTDTFVIHVSGSNRAPIIDIPDQEIPENSTLVLNLLEYATDPDGDSITFEKIEGPGQVTDNEYTYTTDYESAGQYTVKITVSDGVFTVEDTFVITVNDVNRAPSIEIGNQVVNEGEVLEFNLEEYATDPDGDALSFTMISGVGRIEGNVYSYSPDYSDAGTYEVTIKVADGKGGEAQDSFTITVNDVNRAPIVEEITDQTMYEGKKISLPIVGNDPDGDLLTYELKSGPGMIISNIYSFKADYDDSGTYSVIIRVSDEKGAYTEITFTLVVLNSNRPPEVDIPNQNAYETEPINIQILDYINDPDGDEVSVRKVSGVGEINGMVYSWTPDYESAGEHEVIIAVSDGEYTVTDSFTITVENTNRPPILQIPDKHTSEGSTLVFDLSEYASDPDGDALSFRKVSGDGELSGSVFTYTAGYEDEGDHEVVVAVSDGATEVTDTFVIHVSGSNRAPIIDIPDQEIPENSTLVLNLLEYATDPDGDSITFEKIEGPGQVTDNEYTYTTDYESAGQYTVKITVSDGVFTVEDTFVITVNDVNRAPSVEIGDQVVNEGEVLELNLEEYATDPDGDALSFTMISGVGRIEGNVYSYSPDYSDAGTYEVTIKVTDGKGGEAQDSFTITVNDVNRAPSIDVPDQSVSETQTLTINLLNYAMDPDGDSLTFEKVSGVGSIDGNIFSYTPGYDDAGTHVVTIKAIDSRGGEAQDSFTITVNDVNRAPSIEIGDQVVNEGEVLELNLEEYATDPDGDALSFTMISGVGRIEGNVYSYSPDYSDAGTYEVTIKVTDGKGGEAQDSFTITVNDVNRAPSIDVPDQSVSETQTLTINLLNYAMDPDGDSLTFEKVSGVGSIDGNIFSYTPGYDDAGTHVVTIKAIDSRGGEAQDSFTITVNDVNRAPSIEIGDQVVNEGEVLELNLEEYATDPDGDALSFTMISGVGRIEGNVYSYSPDYSDAGTYEVTIKVTDGKGGEAQDSFTITVNDVNRAPSIDVPDQSVSETQTLTINLLNYAMDPDGDSLTFEKVSGVGSIDGNIFSYTPGYDDAGTHVVTIKAIDGRGGEAQDSFNINVSDKNRPPQFTSFSPENGASNVSTNTTLEWSAIDLDGDTITYDLYFGLTETPPIVLSSTSAKNYVPEVLIHGTTYYWKVIASDGKSTVSSETMSFSVEEESFNESSLGIRDSVLEANSLEDVIIHAKGLENVAGIQIVIEYEPEYIDTSDVSVTLMGPIEGFLKVVKQLEGNRLLISVADISGSEIDILDEDIMKITLKTLTAGKTEIRFVGEETEVKDSSLNSLAVDTKDKGIFWIK